MSTSELIGVAAFLGLIAAGIYFMRSSPRPQARTLVNPGYPEPARYQPAARPKLIDLHLEYDDDRRLEIRRQEVQRRLDQAALDRETLLRIAQITAPPETGTGPEPGPKV